MAAREKDRAQKPAGVDAFDPQWFREVEHNAEFRRLLEQMSAVILELDEEMHIVYVTPNVESISGYTPEELIGSPSERNVHKDDLRLLQDLQATPESERQPITYRSRHKAGHWIWIETAGRTRFTAPDGTTHAVSFSRDVTRLKQAEVREWKKCWTLIAASLKCQAGGFYEIESPTERPRSSQSVDFSRYNS